MKKSVLSLLMLFVATAAHAGQLYTDGTNNYFQNANGTRLVLGQHCGDYSGDGTGEIIVYRNCGTNWELTDEVGLVQLGVSCSDFRGTATGSGSVSYLNDGTVWTIDAYGRLSPAAGSGGC